MNREWVSKKNAEREQQIKEKMAEIRSMLEDKHFLRDDEIDMIMQELKNDFDSYGVTTLPVWNIYDKRKEQYGDDKCNMIAFSDMLFNVTQEIKPAIEELGFLRYSFDTYLDSEPVEFDGDIIITDPCYIIHKDNDWDRCGYGDDLEALGITHYMTRDTLYGDWSCTVFNTDNRRKLGNFCADAGLVSVISLDEVLKYNPSFDCHINRKWTTTVIKNFKGTVQFVVEEEQYEYKGKRCTDYSVKVVGHGINKRSGKPVNFVGLQTGF